MVSGEVISEHSPQGIQEQQNQEPLHNPQHYHSSIPPGKDPPPMNISSNAPTWLITGVISIALAVGGGYVKRTNDQIVIDEANIQRVLIEHLEEQHNLDIIDAKMNLLLQYQGINYNGPEYKTAHPTTDPATKP